MLFGLFICFLGIWNVIGGCIIGIGCGCGIGVSVVRVICGVGLGLCFMFGCDIGGGIDKGVGICIWFIWGDGDGYWK